MPTVNHRGWTTLDSTDDGPDPETPRGAAVSARANALMNEWSELHHAEEQEGFRRMAEYEDGGYGGWDPRSCDCGVECICSEQNHHHVVPFEATNFDPCGAPGCKCQHLEDGDELCVHDREALTTTAELESIRLEGRRLKMELIEHELDSLGLRKMRPYEHHNEDERYYQYMEEGRFGHYSE